MAGIFSSNRKKKEEESRQGSSLGIFTGQAQRPAQSTNRVTRTSTAGSSIRGASGKDTVPFRMGAGKDTVQNPSGNNMIGLSGIARDFITQSNAAYARGDLDKNSWLTAYQAISNRLKNETNDRNKSKYEALQKSMQEQGRKFFSRMEITAMPRQISSVLVPTNKKQETNSPQGFIDLDHIGSKNLLTNTPVPFAKSQQNPQIPEPQKNVPIAKRDASDMVRLTAYDTDPIVYEFMTPEKWQALDDGTYRESLDWKNIGDPYSVAAGSTWGKLYDLARQKVLNDVKLNNASYWFANNAGMENLTEGEVKYYRDALEKQGTKYDTLHANRLANSMNPQNEMNREEYVQSVLNQKMEEIRNRDGRNPDDPFTVDEQNEIMNTQTQAFVDYDNGPAIQTPATWKNTGIFNVANNALDQELQRRGIQRKYADITIANDFEEKSVYEPKPVALEGKVDRDKYYDIYYNAINGDADAKDYLTNHINPWDIPDNRKVEEFMPDVMIEEYMSDEDRQKFNYLWKEKGRDAALEFMDDIHSELVRKAYYSADEENRKLLENAHWSELALANIISIPQDLSEGIANAALSIADYARTGQIDPYTKAHTASQINEVTDARIRQAIQDAGGSETWQDVSSMGYQGAIAAAKSALSLSMGGAVGDMFGLTGGAYNAATEYFSLGIMSLGSASSTLNNELLEGVPQDRAILDAMTAGTVEFLTEKIGMDNLFNSVWNRGGKSAWLTWAKQVLAEGSEELVGDIASDALGNIYDQLRNENYSELERRATAYIYQNGLAPADRDRVMQQLFRERMQEYVTDTVIGGLSAAGEATFGSASSYRYASAIAWNVDANRTSDVVQFAQNNLDSNTKPYKDSFGIQQKINNGTLTDGEARKLIRGVIYEVNAIEDEQKRNDTEQKMFEVFGLPDFLSPSIAKPDPEILQQMQEAGQDIQAIDTAAREAQKQQDNETVQEAIDLAVENGQLTPNEARQAVESYIGEGDGSAPSIDQTGLGQDMIAELSAIGERRAVEKAMAEKPDFWFSPTEQTTEEEQPQQKDNRQAYYDLVSDETFEDIESNPTIKGVADQIYAAAEEGRSLDTVEIPEEVSRHFNQRSLSNFNQTVADRLYDQALEQVKEQTQTQEQPAIQNITEETITPEQTSVQNETVQAMENAVQGFAQTLTPAARGLYNAAIQEGRQNGMTDAETTQAFMSVYNAGANSIYSTPTANARRLSVRLRSQISQTAYQESMAETNRLESRGFSKFSKTGEHQAGVVATPVVSKAIRDGRISQKTADTINRFAKMLGVRVNLIPTADYNGEYRMGGGTINIAIDSWILGKENANTDAAVLATFGHELTHRLQDVSSSVYQQFSKQVAAAMGNREFTRLVNHAMNREAGISLLDAQAEVIADFVGREMFRDTSFADKILNGINTETAKDRSALQGIRDFVRKVIEWIQGNPNAFKNPKQVETALERLETSLTNLIEQASKSVSVEGTELQADLEDKGVAVTDDMAAKFSVRTWESTDIDNLTDMLRQAGFNQSEISAWIKDVNGVAATVLADRTRLDYDADEYQTALKPNAEYYYTLDLSTLCKKRRLYQGTYNAIMSRLGNRVLLPADTIALRAMMAEMNHEVPCAICYEESRKKNEGKFAERWLNGYGKRWRGYKNMEHTDPYIPTLDQVTTTDGRAWLRANHPEALESYLQYQKTRGSANPKVSMTHTEYRGEIMNMSSGDVDKVKHIGGLRLQSFSDFETVHVIDLMQAVMDMASRRLTAQAYTKVPAFADIFGGTGIKINLSLIGEVDENGVLRFDKKEGIDPDEAFRIREKYSDNVGTILVGANDASILAAWADPRIDMVIPFHRSGWAKKEFEKLGLNGYKDYTKGQTERYLMGKKDMALSTASKQLGLTGENALQGIYPEDYWDPTKTGKENAEAYLQLCAEKHYRPVFYQFLHDNGDGTWSLKEDGSTDGYWKSLIDFKMYDNNGIGAPQQNVRPIFDMEAAQKTMSAFDGNPNTLPVAKDVVDRFVSEYENTHPGSKQKDVKHSARDADYMNAVNSGDMETAQRMVDEAASDAGYEYKGYHGTDQPTMRYDSLEYGSENDYANKRFPFTEFKPGHSGGIYIASTRKLAEDFTSNPKGHPGTVFDVYVKMDNPLRVNEHVYDSVPWYFNIPTPSVMKEAGYTQETLSTEEISAFAQEHGYDGVVIEGIREGAGVQTDDYIVFNPEQIKSADPVTYDDAGNVIPLSERFNTEKQDIRYSARDSEGNSLTAAQQEYFKNSKVRDANGNLQIVYHGSPSADITEFDRSRAGEHTQSYSDQMIWFTDDRKFADDFSYEFAEGSSEYTYTRGNKGRVYPGYLNITKPFDLTHPTAEIRNYLENHADPETVDRLLRIGNHQLLKQYIDYTELQDMGYDGIIAKTSVRGSTLEYGVFNSNQFKNVDNKNPTENQDIRKSTREENAVNDYAEVIKRNEQREYSVSLIGDPKEWRRKNSRLDSLGLRKKTLHVLDQFGDTISANQREKVVKDVNKLASDMLHGKENNMEDVEIRAANIASDVVFYSFGQKDADARTAMMDDPKAAAAIDYITDYILVNISGTQTYQARNLQKQIEKNQNLKDTLKTVREKRDAEIRRRIDADKARREAHQDSELRKSILKRGKRLEGMRMSDANRALKEQLIGGMNLDVTHLTDGQKDKLTDLLSWVAEQEQNSDFVMSESVRKQLEKVNQTYLDDIISKDDPEAINKLRLLNEALKELEHAIRTQNKLIEDADTRQLRDIAYDEDEILENVRGTTEGWRRSVDKIIVQGTLSPMRFLRRLTGYSDKSGLYRLGKAIDEGGIKKLDYQSRAVKMFDKWMSDKKLVRSWAGRDAKISTYDYIAPDGKNAHLELTPGMRMTLYLASKDYGWMRHMCGVDTPDGHRDGRGITLPKMSSYKKGKITYSGSETYRITKSILNHIIRDMSAEEKAFADKANEFFNGMQKDALNETSQKLIGRDIALVDDYLPITVDDRFLGKEYGTIKLDGTVEGIGNLKERVESGAPVFVRDLTDILMQSIDSTSSYVGLAIPISNFNKLMKAKLGSVDANGEFRSGETTLRKTIDSKWGDTALNYIDKMIADIQHPNYVREDLDKAFAKIRSNYARAVLTLNLSVGLKQAASYPTAAAIVGWRALSKAFVNFKRVDLDLIRKYTPLLWYRSRGFVNPELGTIKDRSLWDNLPKGLDWITGVDFMTTRKLWKAAEYSVQETNPELYNKGSGIYGQSDAYYRAVAEVYNRVIEETQPNYTPWQRPQYLRSHSGITQTLMMFKTQPMQNFNILYDAIGNYMAKAREMKVNGQSTEVQKAYKEAGRNLRRAITSQLGQLVTFAAMTMLWNIFRRKKEKYTDDEGNFSLEVMFTNMGKDIGSGVFGMIPFGSDAWSLLSSKLFGDKYYGFESVNDSVIGDLLDSVGTAWDTIGKILTDDEPFSLTAYKSKIKTTCTAVAKLFGVPAENVFNIITALYKRGQDLVQDKYMADVYSMAWDANPESSKKDLMNVAYTAYNNGDMDAFEELKEFYRTEWGWDDDTINDYLRKLYAAQYDDSSNPSMTPAYQHLYTLYQTEEDAYLNEYYRMIDLGFSEDQIKQGIEKCMKVEAGVDSVADLEERFVSPEAQKQQEEMMSPLHDSDLYKKATADEKEELDSIADQYLNSEAAQWTVARDGVEAGAMTYEEYMQFRLALANTDQPTESGKYGTYTVDEIKAAIDQVGWSDQKAKELWQYLPKYSANNPYEEKKGSKKDSGKSTKSESSKGTLSQRKPASLSGNTMDLSKVKKPEKSEDVSTPESSWIRNIHYDPKTKTMTVTTNGGRTYTHEGVSKETFEEFKNSPSKGKWYNSHF